jgi:DHA3 family macrolide efflux protein-like MFS transporter
MDDPEDDPGPRHLGPFMTLWAGQALSLFGSQAVQFALIWWLTVESRSAAVLTTATLLGLLPQVVLGPVIGTLVDRWNRKTVMLLSDAGVALASLALAVLFHQGTATVPAVFAALFTRALGSAFHAPAMLASTSLMVPPQHLTRIQGLNQALQGALAIAGAPAGALLYATFTMAGVMLTDVVTALVAIAPLLAIRIPAVVRSAAAATTPGGVWSGTLAGLTYLRARRGHMALVLIGASINLFLTPAFALLPLFVQRDLGGSATTLGWMTSLFGIGMVAGGIVLGAWGGFGRRILTTLLGILGLGAAVLALGMAPPTPIAIAAGALLAVGVMVPFCNGPILAILQATIEPAYQGRVFALIGSLAAATAPLGLLLAAPIAGLSGVRAWFLAGGVIALAMGAVGLLTPALVRIEETRPAGEPEASAI